MLKKPPNGQTVDVIQNSQQGGGIRRAPVIMMVPGAMKQRENTEM